MNKSSKAEKALYEGDFKTAEILYTELIKKYSDDVKLYNNLAISLIYQKSYDQALQYLQQIYKKYPDNAETLVNIANTYKFLGNFSEAINFYNNALKISDDIDDAYINLAIIYKNSGDLEKSIEFYNKAIKINPANYTAYYNLAIAYKNSGNLEKSIESYNKTIEVNPDFIQSYINLANIYYSESKFTEAVNCYEQSLKLNPDLFNSNFALAKIFLILGNYPKAEIYLNKSLSLNSNLVEIYFIFGNLKAETDHTEEAILYYNKAIQINPDYGQAYKNIGFAYELIGDSESAREYFNNYLRLFPEDKIIRFHCDTIMNPIMFDNEQIDDSRARLLKCLNETHFDKDVNLNELHEKNIYPSQELNYQGRNNFEIKKKYALLFKGLFPHLNQKQKITGKPKIAFLVTKGHEVIFLKSMKGMINNLSTERFDISIIYNNSTAESLIKHHINPNINLVLVSRIFTLAINEIANEKFDIINYWEVGTDAFGYFLPFCNLAPIQIASWGWPITSGIPEMTYYISSLNSEPENCDEHYTEKLIKLRYIPTYYYRPEVEHITKSAEELGLPKDKNIYLCSQNLRKVHPDFDYLLNGILKRDEKGIVVFISNKYEFITKSLKDRIITKYPELAQRIFFMPFMSYEDYVSLMRISDVSIDTLHYSGANTSYDALANNLPVVTLPGEFHRGKYTYDCYKNMNMDDCIVENMEQYIDLSVKIATDKIYRSEIVAKINKANHLLFENTNALNEFSDFMEKAVETFNR